MKETALTPVRKDARPVFEYWRELNQFSGSQELFWKKFTECIAAFCRSPLVQVLQLSGDDWQELEFFSNESVTDEQKKVFLSQSLSLYKRLNGKDWKFEPLQAKQLSRGQNSPFVICFKMHSLDSNSEAIVVSIICDHVDLDRFNDVVVRTQLLNSTYANYLERTSNTGPGDKSLLYALELLDGVIDQKYFALACMNIVNELATKFSCSRVSIGWRKGSYIKTIAISHMDSFDKNSEAITELEMLYEEAAGQEKDILIGNQSISETVIKHSHKLYFSSKGLSQLVSLPLYVKGCPRGVLTMELSEGLFEPQDIKLFSLVVNQSAAWLEKLQKQNMWIGARCLRSLRNVLSWYLGPNRALSKFTMILFSVLLVLSSILKTDFRLEAAASLETDNVSYLSAPFHSFVENVAFHAGDFVKKGDALLQLNTEELELKKLEEEAKVLRFTREAEKARSDRSLVDMKVSMARVIQAKTELKRIDYYLNQAVLKSPFDGIVVDGDKSELEGSPVSIGDLLLKVVQPTDLYVKIKLPETDIDQLTVGALGELKLISRPEERHAMEVLKVIPVAVLSVGDGNVFIVKAKLLNKELSWWRPGMSGVVYIDAGQKSWLDLALHRTLDAIRMKLWF
ncbi:MAG: HlyD family efflux transporter periplasmic adaptor subunit [Lentisphaeraceae bacterium]|nr:HlyD family efflux transporter periplasmic adaptor subunit [Lentisphaeraceae bacterium]